MKKYFLFILSSLLYDFLVFSQQSKVDSLKNILKTTKEDTNKVNLFNDLSKQYQILSDYEMAMHYANQALILSENISLPKINKGWAKGKASALTRIGNIYHAQGSYSYALKNHLASLKIREEDGDKTSIAASYNNLGIIYSEQGNYPLSLKNHLTSLKIKEEIGDKHGADILTIILELFMRTKKTIRKL